ncbi:MAG: ATP-binding protein [Myxococcales bacterium]|nr:ATP-binding protein [Myxococcales bacterium]
MAFVGGPRQVGKTTLALQLLGARATEKHPAYFNWDDPRAAARLRNVELPPAQPLLVFDEIHKYARWRNLVKGIYDVEKSERQIVVTGSARLDFYRKGGDSLANRYRYFRLHPFTLRELGARAGKSELEALLRFGGFPEPLFRQDETELRLWQRDRISRVVRGDLRDLERVREVSLVEHLVDLLPGRVGSPLSVANLSNDLQIDHKTVERWLQILENMYVCFRVSPLGFPRIRAVKKERKLYLWDWSSIADLGPRFENLVAAQLLKHCHLIEDTAGHRMELRYLRDTDRREVDFVVLRDDKPLFAVECKVSARHADTSPQYFAERVGIPRFFVAHLGDEHFARGRVTVLPFARLCEELDLP